MEQQGTEAALQARRIGQYAAMRWKAENLGLGEERSAR